MTVSDIYARLYNRAYYEKAGHQKFKFLNNAVFVDRRSNVPFVIHMLDGIFYLQALNKISNQSLFRIEMNEDEILLYAENSNEPLWILE